MSRHIAVDDGLKLSPLWDDEVAVFSPASTGIFVVTEGAARLLSAVQKHVAPVSLADLVADLEADPRFQPHGRQQDEIESMLLELERLGLVEAALP